MYMYFSAFIYGQLCTVKYYDVKYNDLKALPPAYATTIKSQCKMQSISNQEILS